MKRKQSFIISLIYFIVCYIGQVNHEVWLDEVHHFLLSRESGSITELIYNSRYEGHPILWNITLYPLSHIFHNFCGIQLFNALVSTTCVYIILSRSPFSPGLNVAIILSYFVIYEYSVITRHYALGLMILLLLLTNLTAAKKNFYTIASLLFLLSNIHLFSLFIAIGVVCAYWHEWKSESLQTKLICGTIISSGFILSFSHCIPPADHFMYAYNREDIMSLKRITRIIFVPLKGILPLPDAGALNYWNSNFFISVNKVFAAVLSLCVFSLPAFIFKRNLKSLLIFYVPSLLILLFFFMTPLMLTNRNCGYISILLLSAYWINVNNDLPVTDNVTKRVSLYFACFVLFIQAAAGIMAYSLEQMRTFSNSAKAAAYINSFLNGHSTKIILSHQCSGPSLVSNTNKPIYYLEQNRFGTYCQWNAFPFINSDSTLLHKINSEMKQHGKLVLILNEREKIKQLIQCNNRLNITPGFNPELIIGLDSATVSSENYFIFQLAN